MDYNQVAVGVVEDLRPLVQAAPVCAEFLSGDIVNHWRPGMVRIIALITSVEIILSTMTTEFL